MQPINTVGHLQHKEEAAIQTALPARPVVTDPFTLQVAAYLKPQYARKFVRQLRQQGLDAYWSEAVRGQKRWYQVRVSHFATKEAARNFGEKLKSQGIIEDYYVANNQPR
jgi:septal ring-binding cell division protein DamX